MPTKRKKNSTKPAKVTKTIHGGSSYRELPEVVFLPVNGILKRRRLTFATDSQKVKLISSE